MQTQVTREEVIAAIESTGLIVILRGIPNRQLLPLAQALLDAGVKVLEITFSADGKVTDAETAENIRLLAEHFAGKLYVGSGTVLTPEQVRQTQQAGGCFALSPHADEAVIRESRLCGLVSIPGAMTPTEIQSASVWGADFVKLFPASTLGPEYLRAVRAPLSHVKLLAVGGITPENIPAFSKAGAVGFGIGTNILDKEALRQENYTAITELATSYLSLIRKK